MEQTQGIRVDKWLWTVRLFKTRTIATEACQAGKVKLNGNACKPARAIRPEDVLVVATGDITRTVRVLGFPKNRVAAKKLPEYLEDLTPPVEYEKARQRALAPVAYRPKGAGRPTKRERRVWERFVDGEE